MKRFVSYLTLFCVIFLSGCGTTYEYATGAQGQNLLKQNLFFISGINALNSGKSEEEMMNEWKEIDKNIKPSEVEGVHYKFRKGEKKESVRSQAGDPSKQYYFKDKPIEVWEYEFGSLYFKKNRLVDVVFKSQEEAVVSINSGLLN